MKIRSLLACAVAILLASCAAPPPQRFASVTGLKPQKEAYYRQLHAAPWPSILAKIKACNIRNYSIYRSEIGGKAYLFSYFEYVGHDFAADMKRMAADPETRRWWKETDPCQVPLPAARKKGGIWADAEEVFHAD
ncbi:MAG: L-rhamnose mutarotase [Verrucomicrobiota bacterium]